MTRFITIDYNSGYIWGDVEAASPIDAVRAIDEGNHTHGLVYREIYRSELTTAGGSLVYTVPADFPAIEDGQDQAMIERLEQQGKLVAVVASTDGED